jgi:hypothetical protein
LVREVTFDERGNGAASKESYAIIREGVAIKICTDPYESHKQPFKGMKLYLEDDTVPGIRRVVLKSIPCTHTLSAV